MWIEEKIDNLIEILCANEYTKIEIQILGDIKTTIVLDFPKFKYIKSKRQLKFYNSKENVIINIWASSDIIMNKLKSQFQILLECDECIILKTYLK